MADTKRNDTCSLARRELFPYPLTYCRIKARDVTDGQVVRWGNNDEWQCVVNVRPGHDDNGSYMTFVVKQSRKEIHHAVREGYVDVLWHLGKNDDLDIF